MYCGFGITVISLWVMVFSTEGLVFRTDLKCGVYKVRCVGCMVQGTVISFWAMASPGGTRAKYSWPANRTSLHTRASGSIESGRVFELVHNVECFELVYNAHQRIQIN